jgi:formate dehydrogenase subunit beta
MNMSLEQIKNKIISLLENGEIRCFIGYRDGTSPFAAKPFIVSYPNDMDKAIFSPSCVGNLVRILLAENKRVLPRGQEKDRRKIVLVVKGCDSRAVQILLQEHILKREDLLLVGMPCRGVIDPQCAQKLWYERSKNNNLDCVRLGGDGLFEQSETGEASLIAGFEEIMAPQCRVCRHRNPVGCDDLVCDEVEDQAPWADERYGQVERLLGMTPAERWIFWQENFSRCIRCNACKDICPLCYCDECTVAKDCEQVVASDEKDRKTFWIDKEVCTSNNTAFHMHRAMHLAGRCVDCGECERACPAEIPLRLLYTGVERAVDYRFGYEAGMTDNSAPVMATYADADAEDFIEK